MELHNCNLGDQTSSDHLYFLKLLNCPFVSVVVRVLSLDLVHQSNLTADCDTAVASDNSAEDENMTSVHTSSHFPCRWCVFGHRCL